MSYEFSAGEAPGLVDRIKDRLNYAAALLVMEDGNIQTAGFGTWSRARRPDQHDQSYANPVFDEAVNEGYHAASEALESAILDQGLPMERSLGKLMSAAEEIMDLKPAYQVLQEAGFQPQVVFSPDRLRTKEWDRLLSGLEVPYSVDQKKRITAIDRTYLLWNGRLDFKDGERVESQRTNGIKDRRFDLFQPVGAPLTPPPRVDPLPPERHALGWDAAVVSGLNGVVSEISPDGSEGTHKVQELRSLLGVSELLSDEEAVALMSPRAQTYNMLQWLRVRSGVPPVDILTTTIQRENLWQGVSCFGSWSVGDARLEAGHTATAYQANAYMGIRPTVSSGDSRHFPWLEATQSER